ARPTIRTMSEDKPLKSAYELAMERLRKPDVEEGIELQPLTDEQKADIAEIRSFYQAKIAEHEVLQQARLRKTLDPAERDALEAQLRHDRERLVSERDAKIDKIRQSAPQELRGRSGDRASARGSERG